MGQLVFRLLKFASLWLGHVGRVWIRLCHFKYGSFKLSHDPGSIQL